MEITTEKKETTPNPVCAGSQEQELIGGIGLSTDAAIDPHFSSTWKVERFDTTYLMTCAHTWDCNADKGGESTYHNAEPAGDVAEWYDAQDWALLKPRDDSSLNTIANEVHTWNPPTCGHVTRDGLIDLKGSGETVYQQGKTTCTTEHQVRDVDYPSNEEWNACFQDTDRTVRVTNKVENGDSGGPILREHYNMDGQKELSIIAPTWATLDDPAVTMGCAAYWIHGDQLVEFGPDC